MNDSDFKSELPPTPIQLLAGLFVLFGTLFLPMQLIGSYFARSDIFSLIGAIFLTPFCCLLGWAQFRGMFLGYLDAMRGTTVTFFVFAAVFVAAYVTNVGEHFVEGGRSLLVAVDLLVVLIPAAVALALALINRRRLSALRRHYATHSESRPRRTVTLREMLIGVSLFGCAAAAAVYLVRSPTPPDDAEHVARSAAPVDLPENATDVSYHIAYRGTKAYEFTTDEPAFRRWVESGIGSLEANRSGTTLQEIAGEHRIQRYTYAKKVPYDEQSAVITDGLAYLWTKEDRRVHAAFDRSTGRAYFHAHYH